MYGINGRHDLSKEKLSHLAGYRNSWPVRIGNGAYDQLQLDIYGELMDSVYLYDKYGSPMAYQLWQKLIKLIDWVCNNWNQPDEGVWEVRSRKKHFLYSRLMCWVALDRGIRLARKRSLPAPLARWQSTRNDIYCDIHKNFWSRDLGAFTQARHGQNLDASSLLMPLVRFISPTIRSGWIT